MNITIKENALTALEKKLAPGQSLRVTVTKGGCAGLTYDAEIADESAADDKVIFEQGPIRIVASEENLSYMDGLVVDFSQDLIGGGLKLTNSNSKSTCGCGASFNLSGLPIISDGNCGK